MILLCGILSEPPLACVAAQLTQVNAPFIVFNQRAAAAARMSLELDDDGVRGELVMDGATHRLQEIVAVYTRLMDDRALPELDGEPEGSPARTACRSLHDTLFQWMEVTPARVINRASTMGSNSSKPYQSQLIAAAGFAVPETLVTNDPDCARSFLAQHGRVIYKSISGTRSIVQELTASDLRRLDDIRWCPVQFQAYVDGIDVRVHVIGDEVFATRVSSRATDYRYAATGGGEPARLEAFDLDDEIAERCVELTRRLGMEFTGLDLRLSEAGEVVCFEANPCPAYAYYEGHTGQPIAAAVARHLASAGR